MRNFFITQFIFIYLISILHSNSRVAFSRPGPMIHIPSISYDSNSTNLFSIDVSSEILNFSNDYRRYNGSLALKFQKEPGINMGFSGITLADPQSMKEAGFHIQKQIVEYGDMSITAGIHDFIYKRDGEDQIFINDISFFGVFSNYKKFDNYALTINFGAGSGKLGYDPQTEDKEKNIVMGGFLGFNLKTPYFRNTGGLDLIMEYDGLGLNCGFKIPITNNYILNFGVSHFENLSEFASESKVGNDRQELQPDAPAICFGFTFTVPNLLRKDTDFLSYSFDGSQSTYLNPNLDDRKKVANLINTLRDSIMVSYYENKTVFNENLLLKQKIAVLMDSTRQFYLKKQVDKTNFNIILRHISRSLRFFYAEEYREALHEIDKAIEINPNIALAYARRGSIYYRLGDFNRATMNWNIALKLDPEFTEIQELLKASKENRLSLTEIQN